MIIQRMHYIYIYDMYLLYIRAYLGTLTLPPTYRHM